jgi:rod shape-determining protein MreD
VIGLLKLAAFGALLLLAQALLGSLLPPALRPDLALVLALGLGLHSRATGALALAFGVGFAVDVLSGAPLGLYALLRGTACAATRLLDQALYLRAGLPRNAYVFAYALADPLLLQATLAAFAPEARLPWDVVLWRAPGVALLSALAAPAVLSVCRRLDERGASEPAYAKLAGARTRP